MITENLIINLFCKIDDETKKIKKYPQSSLYPSEIITLAILFSIKGVGSRAFYRWLENWLYFFPKIPERTRLFRLFKTHQSWAKRFMANPTILGVTDSYGIELIHPMREGRSDSQIGKKGKSNHRWIVGGKLCFILNKWGLIVDWDCATANVPDKTFQPLIIKYNGKMIIFADTGFHDKKGDPENIKICKRGEQNFRMLVETVFSMLTTVCHFKKMAHRVWEYFTAKVAYTMAAFNILTQWHGLNPDKNGFVHLSIADFSL